MLTRSAEKAGSWYPADRQSLSAEIAKYTRKLQIDINGKVVAAIAPHAGFAFSGAIAGQSFAAIRETRKEIKTFIILGAVHTMPLNQPAVWAEGNWDTPLGEVEVDSALALKIIANTKAENTPAPHYGDNAIELHIPFIKHCFDGAKIVPIAVPSLQGINTFGEQLYSVCKENIDSIAVIGSTDLTHYGAAYGYAPAGSGEEAHQWSKANDRELLDLTTNLQAQKIVEQAHTKHSACGAGALAATTAFAHAAGCRQGLLLDHRTSQEVMPQERAELFVGYAAVVFPL